MRVGCLSTINNPFLGYWLRALEIPGVDVVVFLDETKLSDKNVAIIKERVGDRMPPINLYRHHGVPFYFVRNHSDEFTAELTRKLKLDLLANCGTPHILKGDILKAPRIGVLNCHPGRLPEYRGCSAVEWALHNGDPVCNTAHLMTEEIDNGPIIAIEEVQIAPGDSYRDIRVKTHQANIQLLADAVKMLTLDEKGTRAAASPGKYWDPIPDDLFEAVKAKRSVAA